MTTSLTPAPAGTRLLATPRGRLVLAILGAVAFLDFVDASIVNIALPDIGRDLELDVHDLQWVVSGYLLTYGGFMLLGGRLADLVGRRRVLVWGTVLFGASSLTAGLAQDAGLLVASRLAQGLGAALMVPAALSLLTTTFVGQERQRVLAVWGGIAGLGGAVGVLAGGLFTEGPGWRWIFFVNPPVAAVLVAAVLGVFADDRRRARVADLDVPGGVLVTGAMLAVVFMLVEAPDQGWGSARTLLEACLALVLLAGFVLVEARARRPLIPLSVLRLPGLAAANVTQLVGVGGFVTMFFFLTLSLQEVLGYSPLRAGIAFLPATLAVGVSVTVAAPMVSRFGTRPTMVVGAIITALGMFLLSGIDVGSSYVADVLPGLVVANLGIGGVFVGTTTAANSGVPASLSGLAAALVNASQQVGGALGLAVLTVLATTRTTHLLGDGTGRLSALAGGFERAFWVAGLFLLAAGAVALLTRNTTESPDQGLTERTPTT